jgi:pimeloyl-ACP methyl ester carboxylesterase
LSATTRLANATQLNPVATAQPETPLAEKGGPTVVGEWQGILADLHLSFSLQQAPNGSLSAKLISVDQGNAIVAADAVSFTDANGLKMEFKAIRASFEARLSPDGSELSGTFEQGGNSFPLMLRRPGATTVKFTLKPHTIGHIPFEPCRTADGNTEGLCGKYEVYENRLSKMGRKIALNIMVLPSLTDNAADDPFFPIAGGPGQSAVDAYPMAGYTSKVRQTHDVVLVDQRGTGASNPLNCPVDVTLRTESPVERIRACRAELEKKADLKLYTTSIAADDLDEVRQAMGYNKINLFGASYGTHAALIYLRRHGDSVRTMTLEAVVPPDYRIPLPFARGLQHSMDQLMDRCAADPDCHKDFPDLRDEFQTILERLDKSPEKVELTDTAGAPQTITYSRGLFVASMFTMLYFPEIESSLPYMIHRAYNGDWKPYGNTTLAIINLGGKLIARGMQFSVLCSEDVPGLTDTAIRKASEGTYLGEFVVRRFQSVCREWAVGDVDKDFHARIHSAVPALLISGELDPATPPNASTQAARDLINSRVVTVKNGTHGTGSPCIDGLITQFVEKGSAAGLDASCADQIQMPPFLTQTKLDAMQKKASDNK